MPQEILSEYVWQCIQPRARDSHKGIGGQEDLQYMDRRIAADF